ncbi:MAG: hypothetical protein QOH56_4550 [Pseudonocardiales bacterium]|jgi:hypothetical protein|nr:hypothetical protein [Pseudonocardiales bacterium]
MWKKIAVAGATAAIIGGAGTAALAVSGTSTPAPSTLTSASSGSANTANPAGGNAAKVAKLGKRGRAEGIARLRKVLHGTWVTEDKSSKTFVTHAAIRGQVTTVSATSITVKASDNVTQTYVVNATTKVHTRAKKTGAAIADVKSGDPVLVAGIGTGTLTATQVVDSKK